RPTAMLRLTAMLVALHVPVTPPPVRAPVADKVKVVTSLTTYGAIAREIVGDRGIVSSIATGDENPHYVQPKPSFVPLLGQADVFVTTGLDLELWVPALLDKANNPKVTEGGPGYVAAYAGIDLLDVPTSYSRAQGDIHVYGNPHIWTSPLNAVQIARNILTGLKRVSPQNDEYFTQREKDFEERIYQALFGDELVKLLSGPTLADLDRQGKLFDFLKTKQYQGAPLLNRLGGWLKEAMPFRGKPVACYQGVGLLLPRVRPPVRGLHRAEARNPTHSRARAGGDQRNADATHSSPPLHELLRPQPGHGSGAEDRCEGRDRAVQHRRPGGDQYLLRPHESVDFGAGTRVRHGHRHGQLTDNGEAR